MSDTENKDVPSWKKCLDILDSMNRTLSLTIEECRIDLASPANAELRDIIEQIKEARLKTERYGEEHKDTDGKHLT